MKDIEGLLKLKGFMRW